MCDLMKYTYQAGNFEIYETINAVKLVGFLMEGAGQAYYPSDHPSDGHVTRLIWKGPKDQPMFKGSIRHGVFRDIQFVGGILHIMPIRGLGTGLCTFERCSFYKSGVKFGDESYNGNAADSSFRDCTFNKCENPIELTTSQNVNYLIENSMFYRCPRVVNVLGGGIVTMKNCYMTQMPVVYEVRGDGSKTGTQNGNFVVRDLRYDWKQDVVPTIVRDTSSYGSRVLVADNIHSPRGVNLTDVVNKDKIFWDVKVR